MAKHIRACMANCGSMNAGSALEANHLAMKVLLKYVDSNKPML